MIDEKKLIEERPEWLNPDCVGKEEYNKGWNACNKYWCNTIDSQPKVGEWIPVSERLPEEHDTMFAKFKGTDKWSDSMFAKKSDKVNVTVEFDDGSRMTQTLYTIDGEWKRETNIKHKVIAWQPLPEPYKGGIRMITDYEHMLISALRYALGRRTYIVELTCEYIENELPKLSDQCKAIMIEDIERQEQFGDECDKEDWMQLLEKLKEQE